ncbi:hypothetical protein [Albidovulum sediminis]|uniref:Lipopolysaccharide export system protein LptC n=1 Tax=Albidovulum sediminis TaxID=3066345 RepID=A0ABT2NRN1_9RHOB|nr:hypothetical protein [Defluviimonas sediminis]MCT8331366.1 hypothetical protein [Defluviimonas sediminis]
MSEQTDLRTLLVFWLKILLPLAALVILSTLFLVSRRIDTEETLPYAEVDVDALAREQRLTAPEYSGVTGDGTTFLVRAGVARPLADGGGLAESVTAELETTDGLNLTMAAGTGSMDPAAGGLLLTGGVHIETSTGYTIDTQGLSASTSVTEVHSEGAIRALAPFGTLEAGAMSLAATDGDAKAYVLVFNQGVKLIYEPEN